MPYFSYNLCYTIALRTTFPSSCSLLCIDFLLGCAVDADCRGDKRVCDDQTGKCECVTGFVPDANDENCQCPNGQFEDANGNCQSIEDGKFYHANPPLSI